MRLGLSYSTGNVRKTLVVCVLFVLCLLLFFLMLSGLKPAFVSYSKTYANNMINRVVNDAVNKVFSEDSYNNMSAFRDSSENNIKAIETDTAKINRLKADINTSIQDMISTCETETVKVPLGSALNSYFFAGLGPEIPVRICPVSIVKTDIDEEFNDAGINQVHHKLYLNVSVEMAFAGVAFTQTETIDTKVLLTETVIVGDTPKYYGSGNVSAAMK